jgi:mono/diheme cytochrome c family protein
MRLTVLGAAASCTALLLGAVQAQAATPPAAKDAAQLEKGADLFSTYSCGGCHTLQRAGATGRVGPSFDGNATLDQAYIVDRVTNGQGMMPSFGSQMSQADIAAVAAYVLDVKGK